MGFVEDWNEAIDNDPYWQFEELLEEDPELANAIWELQRVATLAANKLKVSPEIVINYMEKCR